MCKFEKKIKWKTIQSYWIFSPSKKNFCLYMYKMSSRAKELTQIRTITAEKYLENKIHIIFVHIKFTNEDYVLWVKLTVYTKI